MSPTFSVLASIILFGVPVYDLLNCFLSHLLLVCTFYVIAVHIRIVFVVSVMINNNFDALIVLQDLHGVLRILGKEVGFGIGYPRVTSPLVNVPDVQEGEYHRGTNQ